MGFDFLKTCSVDAELTLNVDLLSPQKNFSIHKKAPRKPKSERG